MARSFWEDRMTNTASEALARLRAPLDKLETVLTEIGGCGDGNCCIHRPGGQHTNGGCRCVYATRDNQAQRHKVEKVLRNYQIAVKEMSAALDAIAKLERK